MLQLHLGVTVIKRTGAQFQHYFMRRLVPMNHPYKILDGGLINFCKTLSSKSINISEAVNDDNEVAADKVMNGSGIEELSDRGLFDKILKSNKLDMNTVAKNLSSLNTGPKNSKSMGKIKDFEMDTVNTNYKMDMWRDRWTKQVDSEEVVEDDEIFASEKIEETKNKMHGQVPVYKRIVDENGRAYGTGRRKEAVAQVWIWPGTGVITVNKRLLAEYFTRPTWRFQVVRPFQATATWCQFDVLASVTGGGLTGQSDAIRLGIARALARFDPSLAKLLRLEALLTVDVRRVEPKKPGRYKARKGHTFVKR